MDDKELIKAHSAKWIIAKLSGTGIEAARLLKGTNLRNNWLDGEDSYITYTDYARIVTNALDMAGEGALGLKLGRTINPALFGPFGYALLSSRTLENALDVYFTYQELPGQLTRFSAKKDPLSWTVNIDPLYPYEERVLIYAIEESLSIIFHGMALLANQVVPMEEIHLTYSAPRHAELYEKTFRCPVNFMMPRNQYKIDTKLLRLHVSTANPMVHEHCIQCCEDMMSGSRQSDSFIEKIRSIILMSPGRFPHVKEVASELAMGTRTLHRSLRERNTSYIKLLNEIRFNLSIRYLSNTNLSIEQISDLVGFSDGTAFRRAFKKWTNKNASQYRKEILARVANYY